MSEWNIIHENFHTKHSVLTAPDEHMPYISQLHIMSIRWAYYEQMKQQNIWSVHITSIAKENRSSQCLSYKEQYGRRGGGGKKKRKKERELELIVATPGICKPLLSTLRRLEWTSRGNEETSRYAWRHSSISKTVSGIRTPSRITLMNVKALRAHTKSRRRNA